MINKVKLNLFTFLVTAAVVITGCVPSSSDSDADCDGASFNPRTRSCSSSGSSAGRIPVGKAPGFTIMEDAPLNSYSLPFSDSDGDNPTSCRVYSNDDGFVRRVDAQGLTLQSQQDVVDASNIVLSFVSAGSASVSTATFGSTKIITVYIVSGTTTPLTAAGLINGDGTASSWVSAGVTSTAPLVANSVDYVVRDFNCNCASGSCSFLAEPADHFSGTSHLFYTISDEDGTSALTSFPVHVTASNDTPSLSVTGTIFATERYDSDTTSVSSGNLRTSSIVAANDSGDGDTTGSTLTFELVTAPTYGTLTLDTAGNYTYYTYNHQNSDSFVVRVKDPDGTYSSSVTVPINISTVNDAPKGTLTSLTTFSEDADANGGAAITLTYSDEEGDPGTTCSITAVSGSYPKSSCACAAGTCTITIGSVGNFNGAASFNYQVFDGNGGTGNDTTVSFSITAVDDDPVMLLTAQTTGVIQETESTTHIATDINFTLDGASELDGHSIASYSVQTAPTNGTLSGCLTGSSTALTCVYSPSDGNVSDAAAQSATLPSTDLARIATDSGTFYARNLGDTYNGINIHLIDVTGLNAYFAADAKAWYNGGAVYMLVDAGVADGADILAAVNADATVSKIIQFDSNGATQNSVGTLTLAGGAATADKFTVQVTDSNGDTSTQVIHISITPTLDSPTICEYSNYSETTVCGINGCIGASSPVAITPDQDGLTYYNTSSGACYQSSGGSWSVVDNFIKDRTSNELDTIVIDKIKIDEGGGSVEDAETITITNVDSSDAVLVPTGSIQFYYDSGDDGFTVADLLTIGTPFAAATSGDSHNFKIHITPQTILTPDTTRQSTIEITLQDSSGNVKEVEFVVTVQKISVAHGGWKAIKSVGPKVNNLGIVEDDRNHCAYSLDMCETGNECQGTTSPIGNSSADPDHHDAIYMTDSGSTTTCYRMKRTQVQNIAYVGKTSTVPTITYADTGSVSVSVSGGDITVNIDAGVTTTDQIISAIEGDATAHALVKAINLKASETENAQAQTTLASLSNTNWESFTEFCAITPAAFETGCAQGARSDYKSCIGTATPVGLITPTKLDSRYFDEQNNTCYRSTGLTNTDWESYDKSSSITITWNAFSLSGSGTISEYRVFRRLAGDEFDFSQQLNREAITGSATSYQFIDDAQNSRFPPVPGTVYYYVVRPVINGVLGATSAESGTGAYGVVRIMAPPRNMVFTHRWMANKAMCDKIDSASDETNNYRCPYKGPGDTADATETPTGYYYDVGKDMLVDRFEAGCPYFAAPNCPGTSDQSCIGADAPGATGANISAASAGIVYYDRSSAKCYISTGVGVAWTQFDTADLTNYFSNIDQGSTKKNKVYNSSGLPPFTHVTQAHANASCSNLDDIPATEILGVQNALAHGLPTRKDQISYSHWDDSLSDGDIGNYEAGFNLVSDNYCNGTSASGLSSGYNNLDKPDSNNYYSLPATSLSNIRSLTTGSDETQLCESAFGVRDFVGNVAEWSADRMVCANMSTCTAPTDIAGAAQTDYASSDGADTFLTWLLDFTRSSCVDFDGNGDCDRELPRAKFSDMNYQMGRMLIPMGLPVKTDAPTTFSTSSVDFFQISSTITSAELHNDEFAFNNLYTYGETTSCGAFVAGGHYGSSTAGGMWNVEVYPCTATSYGAVTIGDVTVKVDQDPTYVNRSLVFDNLGGAADVVENGTTVEVNLDTVGTTATNIAGAINTYFGASANEMAAVVSGTGATVQSSFSTAVAITDFTDDANPQRPQIGFRCKIDIAPGDYDE